MRFVAASNLFALANFIEAGLWICIGIGFAIVAGWKTGVVRRRLVVAAVGLVLFGVSDIMEVQTGAWYRPVGLLVWKGICVLVLGEMVIWYLHNRRRDARRR